MTRFIVVRHGESEGNAKSEFHGQYNSDLTEKGHAQAECTAQYLDKYRIDKIYSSDIRRAFSTALHTANRRSMTVIPDTALREIKAGKWEQMRFDDIAVQYPETYRIWFEDIGSCRCPGGESVAELRDRVKAEFDKIASENDEKTIMVATHATPLRGMWCVWHGLPISEMKNAKWAPNASVTVVDYDNNGGYEVVMYGEAEHLIKEGLVTELPKNI